LPSSNFLLPAFLGSNQLRASGAHKFPNNLGNLLFKATGLGRIYRSLSEIARAITGTRWSGPGIFRDQATRAKGGCRMSQIRCAIYTRKSSEEELEQSFNSLDAQREACEAYIRKKHEGWQALNSHYNDGGFSGGNMERPALKRLRGREGVWFPFVPFCSNLWGGARH
jgi:hypothetical protein